MCRPILQFNCNQLNQNDVGRARLLPSLAGLKYASSAGAKPIGRPQDRGSCRASGVTNHARSAEAKQIGRPQDRSCGVTNHADHCGTSPWIAAHWPHHSTLLSLCSLSSLRLILRPVSKSPTTEGRGRGEPLYSNGVFVPQRRAIRCYLEGWRACATTHGRQAIACPAVFAAPIGQ